MWLYSFSLHFKRREFCWFSPKSKLSSSLRKGYFSLNSSENWVFVCLFMFSLNYKVRCSCLYIYHMYSSKIIYYLTVTASIQIDNSFLHTHFSQAFRSLNTHGSSSLPLSPNSIFISLDLFFLLWPTGFMTHGPSIWAWIYRYPMSQKEFKSVGISDYNDFLSFKIFKFFQWSCDWLDPISLLPHLSLNMFIGSMLFCFYTGKQATLSSWVPWLCYT